MKERLAEISLLRPVTIVVLVLMHAFTMYAHNWSYPEGIHDVRPYFWIQKYSFACMLEMFVFMSGYIFGFQIYGKRKTFSFSALALGKARRLLLPSIVFGLAYIALFTHLFQERQWLNIALGTLYGYGHLWFLPMLFWCFLAAWLLFKTRLNDGLVLSLLAVIALFSWLPLPMQLGQTLYYLPFFYAGTVVFKHRGQLMSWAERHLSALLGALVLFVVMVFLFTRNMEMLRLQLSSAAGIFDTFALRAEYILCRLLYSSLGVAVFYLLALLCTKHITLRPHWELWNKLCFAVYIFQQFVLEWLYYHTSLPQHLGSYLLPWVGFAAALVMSYVLARLFLLTRTGRFLLG